ncbi:J domain-containing protein [Hyphomicrobium sp. CS1GBMeth3]|uniref:J domain-containing protein n=1 Tax=Hyphomicrobium sp. CS1GBMeth3 TaxID=1892845 RepID=UPI0009306FC4|nr:J domain-containing protein [Hyphomicrobium sp. CS1GBMeth3]
MLAFKYCGKASFLSILVAALLVSFGARADELLVMPYSCKVIRGQPTLMRSDDQGHPVIGRREQREFRACSPENPDLCRRWTVHRFDMDCGGVRVPWVEVAAAAVRDGRAYVQGGRFELEMPARWSLPPDAPCSRRGDYDGWEFGRLGRFCEERLARTPRVTVAMPTGFAPMLGIDGIFVKDRAPPPGAMADAEPAPSRRDFEPEPVEEAPRSAQAAEPIPEPVKKKVAPKEPPSSKAPPAPANIAPPKEPVPSKAPEPPPPEPARKEIAAAEKPEASGGPIIPTIINGANAPEAPPQQKPPVSETGALPDRPETQAEPSTITEQSQVAGSGASDPNRVAMAEHGNTDPLLPVAVVGGVPLKINATAIMVGCLALLTLLTLVIVLRRGRATPVPALARDLSSVTLGKAATPSADSKGALTLVADPRGRDLATPPTLSSGPPALLGDGMPRTREEALSVLGMGIAPDVNETAIKKIIDGLRLSWHPDHATDPEDRAMRELRLKQINAAWDIIAGERKS